MFLLREFVQNILLVEGKKEDILLKYPNFKDEIDFFVQNDPTSKLKYLDWEMKVLSSGKALEQEIADVVKLFDKFQSQLQKKDINQYSVDDFTTLRDDLFTLRDKQSKKKEKVEKRYQLENKPNSEIVYDSDNYQIILIKNKEASVHFGAGTKWCVTMKQETYFEQYDANNVILFFIFSKQLDKSSPNYKIACSVQRDENNKVLIQEYWNSKDKQINKTVSKVIGSEFGDIDSTIKQIAVQQPKSILAKLKSGEVTEEEIVQIYEVYKNHQNEKERQAVLQLVANSKNIPVEALSQLAEDENSNVRYLVARNPSTPVEALSQLAKDKNSYVRFNVAQNPSTPVEALSQLAKDKNSNVRYFVARNPSTPVELLSQLAEDENSDVRYYVAQNPNTPVEVLSQLAKDKNSNVCYYVAQNPNTPVEVLSQLAKDKNSNVRKQAIASLKQRSV